ncbi:MAG TPA: hypothetical protein VLG69_04995, partial [Candidatus Andersenbacteria bacterium]|nr:hypothetical protein [Candidatus Andersenbacteria bacterium]
MSWLIPVASAHEVYVLQPGTIAHDISVASPNPFSSIPGNIGQFFEWTGIVIAVLIIVFLLAHSSFLQRLCDSVLKKIKRYAPFIARITLGSSLFASGYYHALFGPELPFTTIFSDTASSVISIIFIVIGICIIAGFLTRIMACIALLFFIRAILVDHAYMLTYAN